MPVGGASAPASPSDARRRTTARIHRPASRTPQRPAGPTDPAAVHSQKSDLTHPAPGAPNRSLTHGLRPTGDPDESVHPANRKLQSPAGPTDPAVTPGWTPAAEPRRASRTATSLTAFGRSVTRPAEGRAIGHRPHPGPGAGRRGGGGSGNPSVARPAPSAGAAAR
ncbi:hypothetical protein GCM10009544_42270 [Streptomyces stramineus]|uniref:Uncharacterized protein n=1 Tax=Streptomyces stramineus TaxID=173861 RepID=A0ABP3KBL3_9ACTN